MNQQTETKKPLVESAKILIEILKLNRELWKTENQKEKGRSLIKQGYLYRHEEFTSYDAFLVYKDVVFEFIDKTLDEVLENGK